MIKIKKSEKNTKSHFSYVCDPQSSNFIKYIDQLLETSGILSGISILFSYIAKLFSKSLILRFVYNVSMTIADFFSNLFIFKFLCYEYDGEKVLKNSFLGRLLSKLPSFKEKIKGAKLKFATSVENSFVVSHAQSFFKGFPTRSMRGLGVFLLFTGLISSIILPVRFYVDYSSSGFDFWSSSSVWQLFTGVFTAELLFCLLLCLTGIIAATSKVTLGQALYSGVITNFILFKLLTLEVNAFVLPPRKADKTSHYIIYGIIVGVICGFVNPILIFAALFAIAAIYMIMTKPESGAIILFFALPFAPTMVLAGLLIVTFMAYFLKVLRGKRVIHFELCDILVACLAIIIFFGGVFSAGKLKSLPPAAMYICFISSYFIIKNLICVKKLVKRCVNLMISSCTLVSLYGVYQYLFTSQNGKWIDTTMFTDIKSRVVSTFDNPNVLGEYLIMVLPIILAMTFTAKNKRLTLSHVFAAAVTGGCLIFTWSRGAWLGFLLSALVFFLVIDKRTVMAFTLGIFALPFLPFILPDSIVSRFTSIGNMQDSSTSYRFYIWVGTLRLIKDFLLGGIGIGEGAFRGMYPKYSLAAIETAPHSHSLFMQLCVEMGIFALIFYLVLLVVFAQKCISFSVNHRKRDKYSSLLVAGCLTGVVAISVQGMTDYTWYNYRVYLMFWVVFSLAMAAMTASKDENPKELSAERNV